MAAAELSEFQGTLPEYVRSLGARARGAARELVALSPEIRIRAMDAMAAQLDVQRGQVLEANARDLLSARKRGIAQPLLDRLELDDSGLIA